MECLIGIQFNDFVLLASDTSAGRSIMKMKDDTDKLFQLSERLAMVACGESGDTNKFGEFIQQNVQLYRIRHGYELSPFAAANFTRRNQAEYLRSRTPFNVNLLLAGYDSAKGHPDLYYLDYLGSLIKVPFAVHGYGAYVSLSVFDRLFRPDMTEPEALELLREAVAEIQKRLVISMPRFQVHKIDAEGTRRLEDIAVAPLAVK